MDWAACRCGACVVAWVVVVVLVGWLAGASSALASGRSIQPGGGLFAPAFAHAAGGAAAAPTAQTGPTVSVTSAGPTLQGAGTTGGLDTRMYFEYALGSDPFCSSGGTTGTPATTSWQQVAARFTPFRDSEQITTGLSVGSTYCFRFVAANSAGTSYGSIYTFAFVFSPEVSNGPVTPTGATTASFDPAVWPGGLPTTYQVNYDAAGSPYCTSHGQASAAFTAASATIPADAAWHDVSVGLSGLTPGRQYCAGITAHNSSGQALGWGGTFTAGVPLVRQTTLSAIGQTSATVEGSVDPVGQTTSFYAVFDTAGSTWCRSAGSTGTPSFSGASQTLPFTDAAYHDVSAPVAGLAPDTDYCIGLATQNGSGATLAGSPAPLPALPTLTLSTNPYFVPSTGQGSITSSPAGIACPQACSARLPRGTTVTLHATPDAGSAFAGWNPSFCGACGSHGGPPVTPCANSSSASCTLILSNDTVVDAVFEMGQSLPPEPQPVPVLEPAPPSCRLRANRTVRDHAVLVSVRCTDAVHVNLAGALTERSAQGSIRKLTLRPLHPSGARRAWQLSYKLPQAATPLLAAGSRGSITLTLEYTNSAGDGRATVTIRRLAR